MASQPEVDEEEVEEVEEVQERKVLLQLSSKNEEKNLPRSPVKARSNAIANKAALFENANSSSPIKNTKDPALMSVSERKALFEKNKGTALLPKAAFGMAAPAVPKKPVLKPQVTKPSALKSVVTSKNTDAKVNVASSSKTAKSVVKPAVNSPAKSAIFETGGIASKVAALLNKKSTISQEQIQNSVKEQRQKEMDVLLNRFNKNKEVI